MIMKLFLDFGNKCLQLRHGLIDVFEFSFQWNGIQIVSKTTRLNWKSEQLILE